MKWFHHECTAKHDPRLQVLGSRFGAAGLGVYWGLLEEIGQHSDTFQLKVIGDLSPDPSCSAVVPKIPVKLLARILFTTQKRLLAIIESAAAEGLFDQEKWAKDNILYSPSFEQRADDYTRRQRRHAESVRTECAQGASNVHSEQNRRETEEKRTEQTGEDIDISTSAVDNAHDQKTVMSVDVPVLKTEICRKLSRWNDRESVPFQWVPTEGEVQGLIRGIDINDQRELCRKASDLAGRTVTFESLTLRAVDQMLWTARRSRITNPPGFIRTMLFGAGDGRPSWVLNDIARNPAGASP